MTNSSHPWDDLGSKKANACLAIDFPGAKPVKASTLTSDIDRLAAELRASQCLTNDIMSVLFGESSGYPSSRQPAEEGLAGHSAPIEKMVSLLNHTASEILANLSAIKERL